MCHYRDTSPAIYCRICGIAVILLPVLLFHVFRSDTALSFESGDRRKAPAMSEDVAVTLFRAKEVFLYRVPPRASAGGHRASDWGLGNPLATASIDVRATDDSITIRLFEPSGQLLVESVPIPVEGKPLAAFFEPVVDSSRYFVIMSRDPASKRSVQLGIGFRDRTVAFDLSAARTSIARRRVTFRNIGAV